jgi:hypothetical protein
VSSKHEKRSQFIELYLDGKVLPEDIDDYVDKWHASPGGREIYEFLGMSEEEYSLWLRDPDVLPHIARARRENKPLAQIIGTAQEEMPIAARSSDATKVRQLRHWLEQQGKID